MTALSYYDSRKAIDELFDSHLAQSASVLMSLVDHEIYEEFTTAQNKKKHIDRANSEITSHLASHLYTNLLSFQIEVGNNFLFYSASSPKEPLADKTGGFSEKTINNQRWRIFTLNEPGGLITIHVGEPYSFRTSIAHSIALDLLIPLLLGLPFIAYLIWYSVRQSLQPLNRLANEIHQRKPDQLMPIDTTSVLIEVKPLIDAINRLIQRLDFALENERRFTTDAAHELRTPLAGLKIQAQVAQRTHDEERRKIALQQLMQGIDSLTHMVNQLLLLARLDPENANIQMGRVSLRELVDDNIENLATKATAKEIRITVKSHEVGEVNGNAELLSVLIRNLLVNALDYTPRGGEVFITMTGRTDAVEIDFLDTGPGIPPAQREQVLKRFVRGPGYEMGGSGLGLSIAQRIAEVHNSSLQLGSGDTGGLNVKIVLPRQRFQ